VFLIRLIDASTLTGNKPIDIARKNYGLPAGEWGVYELSFEAQVLGDNR
jgi:hypothetical protein